MSDARDNDLREGLTYKLNLALLRELLFKT